MIDGPKPARYDSFPLVSEFSRDDMDLAIELMSDDLSYQEQEHEIHEARQVIKQQLADLIDRNTSKGGCRWGQMAVYHRGMKTRRTLNAKLLVENGVPASVIEASKKESKPYLDLRVNDLSKPSKGGSWDTESED